MQPVHKVSAMQEMDTLKPYFAKVMPFVGFVKAEAEIKGRSVLSTTAPFDELNVLKVCSALMATALTQARRTTPSSSASRSSWPRSHSRTSARLPTPRLDGNILARRLTLRRQSRTACR